jgi:hypothetical protein
MTFDKYENTGIIAFQEVKASLKRIRMQFCSPNNTQKLFYKYEFIGCGFAIRKAVYLSNGFPLGWIFTEKRILCSNRVLANGHDIIYTSSIKINHRVDKVARKLNKHNYYRFGNLK